MHDNNRLSYARHDGNLIAAYERINSQDIVEDEWHRHSTRFLQKLIRRALRNSALSLKLEAGCGRIHYLDSEANRPVFLDRTFSALQHNRARSVQGDVQSLPFRTEAFDVVTCVGSVLNLVDIRIAVNELARVTKPGGLLILEYERSRSWAYLSSDTFNENTAICHSHYLDVEHNLTLYSDEYVESVLQDENMRVRQRREFHVLTSAVLRLTDSYVIAAAFRVFDSIPLPSGLRNLAANAVIICEKAGR